MSSRKSLSSKFTQSASKKVQPKGKAGKKGKDGKKDEVQVSDNPKSKETKEETPLSVSKKVSEETKVKEKAKQEARMVVLIQKPIEIIQSIRTEAHYELPLKDNKAAENKNNSEDSDGSSKELLRPIFRIGSVDSSQDGDESTMREDLDQVFELKHRTSSLSSQGAEGGHSRQNSLQEDFEDTSLSSSGFSPGSSLKSFEGRNRIDDFSDDSDSNKLRESAELSDDMEVATLNFSNHIPYNRQLRIVTSLDPGLRLPKHDRRSSSPGGFESTGLLRRRSLIFADFLSKRSLSMHLNHFPSDMTIEKFR